MLDQVQVSAFLHFAYLPHVPKDISAEPWAKARIHALATHEEVADESEMIARGVCALKKAFENPGDGPHVVPLSGGLDSRAILGGLLEAGLQKQITTVTFGTPGTLDYEIGRKIARKVGIAHREIDLTKSLVTQQDVLRTAKRTSRAVGVFDAYFNSLHRSLLGMGAIYWSGVGGDALTSVHLPETISKTPLEAAERFFRTHQFVTWTKRGREAYKQRGSTIEAVFGQMVMQGLVRFVLRGAKKVRGEWSLWCTTHNLLKLWLSGWRAGQVVTDEVGMVT